jgi:hypothetical protein
MKRSLMTLAAAGLLGLGLSFSATAMPIGNPATAAVVDSDVIQVRHGHGGHMGRGGRGHHYGWARGRGHHHGWSRGRHRGWH